MDSSYGDVLRVAVEAAREAGDLLRQDFLKPGGPSGHGGHAEADERAEAVIRRRLLAVTPDWGYRGEETAPGGIAGADGHHIWLVDPNDGTHAYLKGFRGSAVSIALLRDGTPVLGVVYAFAAPDNRGDFFSWAEGCGPLQRNGASVERPPWAASLSPDTVVLVSQDADRATAANLACVAPGRYLTVPGIAYRLALAAAGDGEVGVSLNRPGDWDYAGGHALLRGAGGMLIDQDVEPVTYTVSGDSGTRSCFGGAPALLGNIARRPWATVLAHEAETEESLALCWPERGQTVVNAGLLERAQGCLLGQLAGDALGSMVEFQNAAAIEARYPRGLREIGPSPVFDTLAGQPTDDSELALALARTLLRDGAFVEDSVAAAYGYWRESGPFDVGGTIGTATTAILEALERGEGPAAAARRAANRTSEANGALMRQSPLAVWGHALAPAALDTFARADTTLTHPNRVCQDASAAYLVALAATIREGLDATAAYDRARAWDREHGASPTVTAALEVAMRAVPAYEHNQGHVLIALQNAFYQALHAPSVEEGITATVMGGGDTDTNAAIAGALLGAIHGERAIPSRWRRAVLTCRPQRGAQGGDQPRPRGFWPVDALYLAERLAAAGARNAASIVMAPEVFSMRTADASASSLGSRTAAHVVADVSDMPHDPRGAASRPDSASRKPGRTHFVGALLGGAMGDALGRPEDCEDLDNASAPAPQEATAVAARNEKRERAAGKRETVVFCYRAGGDNDEDAVYDGFHTEDAVRLFALAYSVEDGTMDDAEAGAAWQEIYGDDLLDEDEDGESRFPDADNIQEWDTTPGRDEFCEAADGVSISGAGSVLEGLSPASGLVFYVTGAQTLDRLRAALQGRYRIVVRPDSSYLDARSLVEANRLILEARFAEDVGH